MCSGCSGAVERVLGKMDGASTPRPSRVFSRPASPASQRRVRSCVGTLEPARPLARSRDRLRATSFTSSTFPSRDPPSGLSPSIRSPLPRRRRRGVRRQPRDPEGDGQGQRHPGGGHGQDRQDRQGGVRLDGLSPSASPRPRDRTEGATSRHPDAAARRTRHSRRGLKKHVPREQSHESSSPFVGTQLGSFALSSPVSFPLPSQSLGAPPLMTFPNLVASSGCSAHSSSSSGSSRPSHT